MVPTGALELRRTLPWARVATVLAAVVVLQVVGNEAITRMEAGWSAGLAHRLGIDGVYPVPGTSLVRGTHDGQPYLIRITPSCSALTAGLSLAGLSLLVLRGTWRRRLLAAAIGLTPVLLGNLVRIAAILWVGNRSGREELVSFHDWWGTGFALAYLLVGFVAIVALRLPAGSAWAGRPNRTFGL